MLGVDLSACRVAITQGASGIGLATARLFAEAGASVALSARDARQLEQAKAVLSATHPAARVLTLRGDNTQAADMRHFALAAASAFGGVDLLVTNAGENRPSSMTALAPVEWVDQVQQKLASLVCPIRAFVPQLEKSARGANAAIVCVNSSLAYRPQARLAAASAGSACVQNLVRSLAQELAPKHIRVNAVLIGLQASRSRQERSQKQNMPAEAKARWEADWAHTHGVPLGRLGQPDEVARAILFLGTPLLAYTTGSHIDVTGGLLDGCAR